MCLPLSIHMDALNVLGKVDVFFNVVFAYALLVTFTLLTWIGLCCKPKKIKQLQRTGNKKKMHLMFTRASSLYLLFFLILCAPSQMIRIYCTIRELCGQNRPNYYLFSIQQLLQYPYYTGFALSAVVYLVSLSVARDALKAACLKLYRRSQLFREHRTPVGSLATHTVIAMTEITNLKNVSLL